MLVRMAALALLLTTPAIGSAQFLERWEYWGKGYGYGQSGFDIGRGTSGPYPRSTYAPPISAVSCSIRVQVPAAAQVFFDGAPTSQTGADRLFLTPPLDPNGSYTYTITARWTHNGHPVGRTRIVRLVPGQVVHVAFAP